MSSKKVHCYLHTLRREWGLTQGELASLLPRGDRNRVSRVERALSSPNAAEMIAFSLAFGLPAKAIFRKLSEDTVEILMRGAYRLYRKVEGATNPELARKREFVEQLRARVIDSANQTKA
jgi:hypothetical protein